MESLGQSAHLYTLLEAETPKTFSTALNECFGANESLMKELLELKEKYDRAVMEEMLEREERCAESEGDEESSDGGQ